MEEESDSADLSPEADSEDQASSSKRPRVRVAAAKAKSTPVAIIPPSTRTLRPRISKTTAQIEEEKQDKND